MDSANLSHWQRNLKSLVSSKFLEQRKELHKRLEEEAISIQLQLQEMEFKTKILKEQWATCEKFNKDMFQSLMVMERKKRQQADGVLRVLNTSVDEEPWKPCREENPEENVEVRKRTSRVHTAPSTRVRTNDMPQKLPRILKWQTDVEENIQKEMEMLRSENEHLRKVVMQMGDGGLREEQRLRKEKKSKQSLNREGVNRRASFTQEKAEKEKCRDCDDGKVCKCELLQEIADKNAKEENSQAEVEETDLDSPWDTETEEEERVRLEKKKAKESRKREQEREKKKKEEERKRKEEEISSEQERHKKQATCKKKREKLEEKKRKEREMNGATTKKNQIIDKQRIQDEERRENEERKRRDERQRNEKKHEVEKEKKRKKVEEEEIKQEEPLFWAVRRTDEERRRDMNVRKILVELDRREEEARKRREIERMRLRNEDLRCLHVWGSCSSEESCNSDIVGHMKNGSCSSGAGRSKQQTRPPQGSESRAHQSSEDQNNAVRKREEKRKAEEAELDRGLQRRTGQEDRKPQTVAGRVAKFMRKTYQRVVNYSLWKDLKNQFAQHRSAMRKQGQEGLKVQKEPLKQTHERRRRAKQAKNDHQAGVHTDQSESHLKEKAEDISNTQRLFHF